MIGKQTKGTSFGGCVRYVLKEEKSKLLEAAGVDGTPEQMAEQFELQALLNDKVKNIVGHTSLNFSPEDSGTSSPGISTVSIRIATSFSIGWIMMAKQLATRTTSAEMKRRVRC